jgi:hypothetical protein
VVVGLILAPDMVMDTNFNNSRLRYLDADDIDDSAIDFDGLDVRGSDGNKLGDLDGFILDPASGRVHYAVVDSGGWFSSRQFLVPIGHAQLDRERPALTVDITKDAIRRYPAFDADRFGQFSEPEMRAFEQRMAIACCPDEPRSVDAAIQYDTVRHYSQPNWWRSEYNRTDYSRDVSRVARGEAEARRSEPARETFDREVVTARDRSSDVSDMSPHDDGRAQPGDVIGIETGGERSYLGDESEDENKRRSDAERAAAKQRRE